MSDKPFAAYLQGIGIGIAIALAALGTTPGHYVGFGMAGISLLTAGYIVEKRSQREGADA